VPSEIDDPVGVAAQVCAALDGCTAERRQAIAKRLARGDSFAYVARQVGPDEAKRPLNKDIDEATDHYMKEAKGVVNDVVDSAKRAAQAFSDAFKKR